MIQMAPVAYVHNSVAQPIHEGWEEIVSELFFDPALGPALDGVERFSHLQVLFWLHRVSDEQRRTLQIHPRDRLDLPLVGVFATHSQYRPNPIGLTIVELIERHGNVLVVRGLDAIDGTPVLDVKPYVPQREPKEARVPDWVRQLDASR